MDVQRKRVVLPAYFDQGMIALLDEAARRDQGYAHYWIKSDPENRQVRRAMGWEPCEDKELLERLGLHDLIRNDGRAHYMDTEMWRMPQEMQDAIHSAQSARQGERSDATRKSLEAMGADAKGRTAGAVDPYVGKPGGQHELLTREAIVPPVVTKA